MEQIIFTEEKNLEILLSNLDKYEINIPNPILTKQNLAWLIKESWQRCRFKRMVSIQAAPHPASIVFYMNENKIESDAIATRAKTYEFNLFNNANFEQICDIYADVMATELEMEIIKYLPKISLEILQDIRTMNTTLVAPILNENYDYLLAPKATLDVLKDSGELTDIDTYEIPVILDPETFIPCGYAGQYPKSSELPIFVPYWLAVEGPSVINGSTKKLLCRWNWYTGKEK